MYVTWNVEVESSEATAPACVLHDRVVLLVQRVVSFYIQHPKAVTIC